MTSLMHGCTTTTAPGGDAYHSFNRKQAPSPTSSVKHSAMMFTGMTSSAGGRNRIPNARQSETSATEEEEEEDGSKEEEEEVADEGSVSRKNSSKSAARKVSSSSRPGSTKSSRSASIKSKTSEKGADATASTGPKKNGIPDNSSGSRKPVDNSSNRQPETRNSVNSPVDTRNQDNSSSSVGARPPVVATKSHPGNRCRIPDIFVTSQSHSAQPLATGSNTTTTTTSATTTAAASSITGNSRSAPELRSIPDTATPARPTPPAPRFVHSRIYISGSVYSKDERTLCRLIDVRRYRRAPL